MNIPSAPRMGPPSPYGPYANSAYPASPVAATPGPAPRKAEINSLLQNSRSIRKTGKDTELILADTPEGRQQLNQLNLQS
jgi:hypothetical protein